MEVFFAVTVGFFVALFDAEGRLDVDAAFDADAVFEADGDFDADGVFDADAVFDAGDALEDADVLEAADVFDEGDGFAEAVTLVDIPDEARVVLVNLEQYYVSNLNDMGRLGAYFVAADDLDPVAVLVEFRLVESLQGYLVSTLFVWTDLAHTLKRWATLLH